MTSAEQFVEWIELGLRHPKVEDDDWILLGYEAFKKPSRETEGVVSCNILELALIGKCGSFEEAKGLYEATKNEPVPLQLEGVPTNFEPKINLWAYLLGIPYFTIKHLQHLNSEGTNAEWLLKMIRNDKFSFDG